MKRFLILAFLFGACSANASGFVEMKFNNLKECSDRGWTLKNKKIPTRLVPENEQPIAEIECGATIYK